MGLIIWQSIHRDSPAPAKPPRSRGAALRILGLEGDARQLAIHFFDQYREGLLALRDVEERALWEKAREVAAIEYSEDPWRQLREREALMEARAGYLKKIDALENELFNDLAALLPP